MEALGGYLLVHMATESRMERMSNMSLRDVGT